MNEMIEHNTIDQPLALTEMRAQVNLIQQVLQSVMIKDTHFGVIPGTGNKPSLLKPGAEKIMATFRLAADPQVEDLSTPDCARYRVTVRLISPSGRHVGSGIGEASTAEKKYRWRAAVCPQEFDEAPADRKKEEWKKGWNNKPPYKAQLIMTDSADTANTVLKMAKKRALVDAVLTATAASDIFTQDIEDLPEELRPMADQGNQAPGGVQSASQAPSAETQPLVDELTKVAKEGGWEKLREAWGALQPAQRESVGSAFGSIKKIAEGAGK